MSSFDLMSIGLMTSIGSFQKTAKLRAKWQVKKETDLTGRYDGLTEFQRKNAMFKDSYKDRQLNGDGDDVLAKIRNKIYSGSKLTAAEMQYLQQKDPVLYQKMRNLEMEIKKYEKELRQCKTKEDVEKLKFSKVNASLMTIKSVENNPHIPEGVKLQIAQQEQRRLMELEKVMKKFIESGEYAALPTEAEKQIAEEALEEAQKEELGIENTDKTKPQETTETETKTPTDSDASTVNGNITETSEAETTKIKTDSHPEKTEFKLGDGKRTVAEVETSPEFRKAKHKKVVSAYNNVSNFFGSAEIVDK